MLEIIYPYLGPAQNHDMKYLLFFATCLFATACQTNKNTRTSNSEKIYWVNSAKTTCISWAGTEYPCLSVQIADERKPDGWTGFGATIEGFEYEPGNVYKLMVREEPIPEAELLADGPDTRYILINMLEKTPDPTLRLHDIWALQSIDGTDLDFSKLKTRPTLELFPGERRVGGTDGCNRIMGSIAELNGNTLKLGPLGGTKMMCPSMDIPQQFNERLARVAQYQLKNLLLVLMDDTGKEILRLQKVD